MEPVTIAALIAAALAGAAAFAMWQRASDAEAKVVELETEVERFKTLSAARAGRPEEPEAKEPAAAVDATSDLSPDPSEQEE